MRIFLSCQQALEKHNVPAYSFWEKYFKEGIEEAGHEWIEAENVDWAEGLVYREEKDLQVWRERNWSRTIEYIKQVHNKKPIDLFLGYLFPNQVESSAVKEIQALGIPCVNFFCDNVREFTSVPQEYYCFDLNWVPEFKALEMYQKAGLKYIYAPMPVWVPPEQRTCDHPENFGPTFIGSRDALREGLMAQAIKLGAPVEIRGPSWVKDDNATVNNINTNSNKSISKFLVNQIDFLKKYGMVGFIWKSTYLLRSKVPDEIFQDFVREKAFGTKYVEVTQQSRIILGINRYPSFHYPFFKPDTYSRLRDIEVPMMGGCYLTEWTEGLEHLYDLGEEIETYRTAEEMVEKIQFLESEPQKRRKMRCSAQRRALEQHSVAKSIEIIGTTLGLSK